jgi:hypothetical protein
MLLEALVGAVGLLAGAIAYVRTQRMALYRQLVARLASIKGMSVIGSDWRPATDLPSFADRLAVIPNILPGDAAAALRDEALGLVRPERSYVPAHKKGGTVAYETIIASAPQIVSLYHSSAMRELVSRLVGMPVHPTPLHDQSSLSVLFYDRPGDHIGWHYDHNFYRGRHFTVLLPVINEGTGAGALSHATLHAQLKGDDIEIETPPNTLIVFEGAKVCHRVTPILDGERRLVISMTYCTDPHAGVWQGAARRLKDTAFFGIRALWT